MSRNPSIRINGYSKNPASLNYQKFIREGLASKEAYKKAHVIARKEKNCEDLECNR